MCRTIVAAIAASLTVIACAEPVGPGNGEDVAPLRWALVTSSVAIPHVSTGKNHTCAVKTDGTVVCWGSNLYGEGTIPSTLTAVTQVGAGYYHTCALQTDGTVTCWGNNSYGQSSPPSGLTAAVQLSTGARHNCVVRTDETVICWGDDEYGQATAPTGLTSVTQVSAGERHTCAAKTDGTVVCWGWDVFEQASGGGGITSAIQVAADGTHTCARQTDASVACWGNLTPGWSFLYGSLVVPGGLTAAEVVVGAAHTCALKPDSTVLCWGNNSRGQTDVPADLNLVAQISADYSSTCAVKTNGSVVCWGSNDLAGWLTVPEGLNLIVESTPADQQIGALRITLASLGLAKGIERSLDAKLAAALSAIAQNDIPKACDALQDFIAEINALAGKKLSSENAASLIGAASEILLALDC